MSAVTDRLTKLNVPYEAIPHEQAFTSAEEALALGVSPDEVVKTIVLDTPSGHALAVIPGSRRLDIRAVERAVGAKHVLMATEEEIEKASPTTSWAPCRPSDRSSVRRSMSTPRSWATTPWCSPRERRPSRSGFGLRICFETSR